MQSPSAASVASTMDSSDSSLVSQPVAPHPHFQIEPDPNVPTDDFDDNDSAFGADDLQSDTTSTTSSVFQYQYENGRRYHAYRAGQYLQPNDEAEQERLDLIHHWFRLTLSGRLFRAPIKKNPQRVMDIGTGTGIWAIEFGDEFPSAEVTGTDLSAIQPTWVPPNVQFIVDDAELEWTYPDDHFDFIHARSMGGSISDWDTLMAQAYRCLKPGGWLEFDEFECWMKSDDGTVREDGAINEWQILVDAASAKFGRQLNIAESLHPKMQRAGFVNTHDDIYKNPMNNWPRDPRLKEIGLWGRMAMVEGIEGMSLALLTRVAQWDRPRIELLLSRVRSELSNRKIHSYAATHFVYGQKPMTG